MRIDWDDGNWPKCGKHGVSKADIEAVFLNDPLMYPDVEHSQFEERYKAIGVSENGRYVFVIFTFRWKGDEAWRRPLSARFMHRDEIEYYEKRPR